MENSGTVQYRSRVLSPTEQLKIVAALLDCNCIQEREQRDTILSMLNTEFQGIADRIRRRSNIEHLPLPRLTSLALSFLLEPVLEPGANRGTTKRDPGFPIKLEHTIAKLGEMGLNELAQVLYSKGIHQVTFVPYSSLGLFPLHAAQVTLQNGEINDLLFKKRYLNGVPTLGVVRALLSGIDSKVREGEVARCIIDYVTMFDVPYGLSGTDGQVDVGTRHIIIEAKVDSVPDGGDTFKQIERDITNDVMNPPDVNGVRKPIILYAPCYGNAATASVQAIGGHVVKSCEQLRKQIRQLGGP